MTITLEPKVKFEGKHYRNQELYEFIESFNNVSAKIAAWATVRFIRERWPETNEILRGELLGVDEGGNP
jgi:hypothetical protein